MAGTSGRAAYRPGRWSVSARWARPLRGIRAMMTTEMPAGDLAVTQRLLGLAAARGSHQALAGGQGNRSYGYAELATTIRAAAAGLACRGLHPRDVVGVHVADAVCYAVATHAIRAAGGYPRRSPPG